MSNFVDTNASMTGWAPADTTARGASSEECYSRAGGGGRDQESSSI